MSPHIPDIQTVSPDAPWSATLAAATTHAAACRAVTDALALTPGFKPSVYLERGGRLRCQAAATYTHVFDGMPPTVGVIGRTFTTGEPGVVADPAADPDYVAISEGVVAEVCWPVRAHDAVVGVISVESTHPLGDGAVELVRACAHALGRRLEAFGGALGVTPAQTLLQAALRLADERDRGRLHRELLLTAIDLSGMDSAVLFDTAADGGVAVLDAVGPLERALRDRAASDLAWAGWLVSCGASCATVPEAGAPPMAVLAGLQQDGLRSAALLRVCVEPARTLLVAGRAVGEVATETVERLELLCVLAASVGRSCDLLADLERQAATDPLTGLGHHGAFYERLTLIPSSVLAAVVMLDLDRFKAVNDALGHAAGDELLRTVADTLRTELRASDELFRIGGDEFAVLMPAVASADVERMAARIGAAIAAGTPTTASIGVAMTVAVEPLPEAARRADRALYAAKAGGRDRVVVAPAPH